MAQKVQVVLVDDVDGGSADETVTFGIDGSTYEVDLSTAHAAQLREALAPWVGVARKVSARSASRSRGASDTAKVRAWAKQHGFDVSERGRISSEVRAAYAAAH